MAIENQGSSWNKGAIIIALISVIWLVGGSYWYGCKIKNVCYPNDLVASPAEPIEEIEKPIEEIEEPIEEIEEPVEMIEEEIEEIVDEPIADPEPEEEMIEPIEEVEEIEEVEIEDEPEIIEEIVEIIEEEVEEIIEEPMVDPEPEEIIEEELEVVMDEPEEVVEEIEEEIEEEILPGTKILLWTVYFDFGSSIEQRHSEFSNQLNRVIEELNNTQNKISILGHTDDIGTKAVNEILSKHRAERISHILQSFGVDESRITISPMDFSDPFISNNSQAGREINRRAEVYLLY